MDRISELSDDLLIKILLLIPTKVAVSTSILSKRWEYLWMWLPRLEYGHRRCSEPESEKLRCFLERNLPLHRASVIESFRLEMCNSRFKPESINTWVVVALSHCLRELDILYEPYPAKPNILPSNLYTSKSLVILKLDGEILLDVPRMVSLPSLKTLKLQSVRYLYDESLQRLLSNCPILEDLVVKLRGYGDTMQKLTVVVPSLQSLSLFIPYSHEIAEYVIETPSLKYFKLVDYSDNDHYGLIENMPYLIEAYVDCCCPDIYSLINSITYVKRLTICSEAILDRLVTLVFNQLEHLAVCLCTVLFSNQLVQLLNASSKLKRLDISLMDDHDPHQDMDYWKEPSTVPDCLLSSLQSLSWSAYTGEPQERVILVYILKHALHLKTATIESSESVVPTFEMLKELALSSRASTACQLMFE
ncbi:PREDICTED: FBD-associated F-box protein At4g10400-like [Brassica oleracea var. oleracea]|uniref:FBD domain-containing protein n=1 Tax=Brassica oleracea var. oleracea TaxID=109376 RepID=A0A0D3DTD7_BRAOL|nr:PREDICTED: FBD-associated F-box protein At4g10400-like [Brassica oleracea var. oleracea]